MDENVTTPCDTPADIPVSQAPVGADASVRPGNGDIPATREGRVALPYKNGADPNTGDINPAPEPPAPADEAWSALLTQADDLRADYPTFDLGAELQNDRFGMLLAGLQSVGYPDALRTAYQCVHHDDLLTAALGYAVAHTREQMTDAIRTARARPVEGSGAAVTSAPDPAHMTASQIEDVRRRVMQGQRVSF